MKEAFIAELRYEAASTRKMLLVIPEDKFQWKPHEKSMTIGRLASHIAELPIWINRMAQADEFDFLSLPVVRNTYESTEALIKVFEDKQAAATTALQNTSEDFLNAKFTLRRGDQIMNQLPRKILIRNLTLNHIVHHRGQLSVFLRLLDVPVPGVYGPSADEIKPKL